MNITVVIAIWDGEHWEVAGSAAETTDATVERLEATDPRPKRILLRRIEVTQ